jgi:uncharacterized alkaline shock family protein YloU
MTDTHAIRHPEGTITIAPGVLGRVVQRAAEETDGARARRPRRGLDVDVEDGRARVSLELAVRYGVVLPEAAEAVQRRVSAALREICGLETSSVDVSVEELDG